MAKEIWKKNGEKDGKKEKKREKNYIHIYMIFCIHVYRFLIAIGDLVEANQV